MLIAVRTAAVNHKIWRLPDPELGSQGGIQFGLTKAFNETSSGKVPGAEMACPYS